MTSPNQTKTRFVCISGITFACAYTFFTSILADVVDYDRAFSGEERTGIYMALFNLTIKVGLALGVGLAYGLLDLVGFDPSALSHTDGDVLKVRLISCVPTSLLLIPAAYVLWNFPITKEVQKKLRKEIRDNTSGAKKNETCGTSGLVSPEVNN